MTPNLFIPTLLNYLNLFPLILVWLVGLILSIYFWRRHPVVSMLVAISLIILLAERFMRIYLGFWLPYQINHFGLTGAQSTLISKSISIFESLINAGVWSLLLIALFGWRKSSLPQGESQNLLRDAQSNQRPQSVNFPASLVSKKENGSIRLPQLER